MGANIETKLCFIVGIDQRSGTNYLYRLLRNHKDCEGPGPIWEDHILQNSFYLKNYVDVLFRRWNPKWEVRSKLGAESLLLNKLGSGIQDFLKLQLESESAEKHGPVNNSEVDSTHKILLTKMPSIEGIELFFDLFPDAYLLILVRDGRSLIESGVRSFGWSYEKGIKRWDKRAKQIHKFSSVNKNKNDRFLVVKYEDFVENERAALQSVFDFLNIDGDSFDYQNAQNMTLTGSSELKKSTSEVHWGQVEKSKEFNPISRFEKWKRIRHERFNWIAGHSMTLFGYDLLEFKSQHLFFKIYNIALDLIYFPKEWMVEYLRKGSHRSRIFKIKNK